MFRTKVYGPWVLYAYALFFAVIAPFICWGSIGDPGHGHAASHFVFDEEITAVAAHSSESHGHDYCSHDPMLRHNRLNPNRATVTVLPGASAADEGTRSTPVVTLISMIMLLLFSAKETLFKQARHAVYVNFFLPAKDAFLLVPIPPPRVCAFSVA